ncbi:uncharacterized protein [Globicephala melas]|uniref:uncharacterized protein n=1 Tax=Globicephala melas TaxID=9731 RepID=UPI003872A7B8
MVKSPADQQFLPYCDGLALHYVPGLKSYFTERSPVERKLEAAAQRAHPRGTGGGQRFPPPSARKRLNGHLLSLVPPASPRQGRAPRPGAGPGAAHPGPAPIPEVLRGEEERRTWAAPHALRFPQSPVRARARPSPAEFNTMPTPTPCATPRPAQQLRRRGRGGWPDRARGRARARAGDSARPEEAGSARARPRPRAGRRSRSSSGSSCRSRCSWEKRQRGRACSGRTGSLPSPSLSAPLPQTHFRSSQPCRRRSSGGSSRRRRRGDYGRITHLTGRPLGAPARDAHRQPPLGTRFAVAAGREGPATGNGTRIAPLPFLPPSSSPPPALSASVPSPSRKAPDGAAADSPPPGSGGWFCQAARAPAPGAAAPAPAGRPCPRFPEPGPRVVRALRLPSAEAPGLGSFVFFVATVAAGTVCELRWPPPPPSLSLSPGRGRHVGTGPGRRRRCALTCRRCRCGGGCGGGTAGQPWPCSPRRRRLCFSLLLLLLPPRSVSPARRRRRRRGFSCPVTLRSHDRESGATSAKRLRAAPAGGERRRESCGGKSPLRPPSRLPSPRPPPPPAALPPPQPPPPAALSTLPLPPRLRALLQPNFCRPCAAEARKLLSTYWGWRLESQAPCLHEVLGRTILEMLGEGMENYCLDPSASLCLTSLAYSFVPLLPVLA